MTEIERIIDLVHKRDAIDKEIYSLIGNKPLPGQETLKVTINPILKSTSSSMRGKKITLAQRSGIELDLYSGHKVKIIAQKYGVSEQTVYKQKDRLGLGKPKAPTPENLEAKYDGRIMDEHESDSLIDEL